MPTMIQTHLITSKDWATVKDTAKSLEHIIMKCDPPTPAMLLCCSNVVQVPLSLNPFQINLEFGTTH